MDHDVCAEIEGTAHDRCREGVVDDERHLVGMGHPGEPLNVENRERGVGNGFAEDRAGVRPEGHLNVGFGGVGVDEGDFDAEFFEGDIKEVGGAAIEGAGSDEVVAAVAEVEDADEGGGLA